MQAVILFQKKIKEVWKRLNIEQVVSLSFHHQSNIQVEECIKFVKQMLRKCLDSKGELWCGLDQFHKDKGYSVRQH